MTPLSQFNTPQKGYIAGISALIIIFIVGMAYLLLHGRNDTTLSLRLEEPIAASEVNTVLPPQLQSNLLPLLFQFPGYSKQYLGPGYFSWNPNSSLLDIYRTLRGNLQTPLIITQPSLRTYDLILAFWSKQLLFSPAALDAVIHQSNTGRDSSWNRQTALGLFLPQTYELYLTSSPETLVKKIESAYRSFWNQDRRNRAAALQLHPDEVTILASIVQEETNVKDEMPLIAGVYINRLKKNMRLQADPTVRFALGDFTLKRILYQHLEMQSPYNTYRNKGLPPGPINAPEYAAIDAVLQAAQHEFLYFCAAADFSGKHVFAVNFDQHRKNARAYQLALNQKK